METKSNSAKKSKKDNNEHYEENGNNFNAGTEEHGALPNNPAENAEKTSPEEDAEHKKNDTKK